MKTCSIPRTDDLTFGEALSQPGSGRRISPRQIIMTVVKFVQNSVEDCFPNWSHARHQARWERKWARPDYNPFWRTDEPQKEYFEAIETGWLPKDRWVYDIGCGAGESTRWLHGQGLRTLGLDFSASAIDICRRLSQEDADNLRFEVIDMCADQIGLEPTAAIVDRGCFHQIAEHFRPAYVRNAARLTEPGGHFLLLAGTYQRDKYRNNRHACSADQLIREVSVLFAPHFTIERADGGVITTADGGEGMPAVAFWMVRHGLSPQGKKLADVVIQAQPNSEGLLRGAAGEQLNAA